MPKIIIWLIQVFLRILHKETIRFNIMKLSTLFMALCLACVTSVSAKNWEAKWITSSECQTRSNSWICFHKSVELPSLDVLVLDYL